MAYIHEGEITYYNKDKAFGFVKTTENKEIYFQSNDQYHIGQKVYVWVNDTQTVNNGFKPKAIKIMPRTDEEVIIYYGDCYRHPTFGGNPPEEGIFKLNGDHIINMVNNHKFQALPGILTNHYFSIGDGYIITKSYLNSNYAVYYDPYSGRTQPVIINEQLITKKDLFDAGLKYWEEALTNAKSIYTKYLSEQDKYKNFREPYNKVQLEIEYINHDWGYDEDYSSIVNINGDDEDVVYDYNDVKDIDIKKLASIYEAKNNVSEAHVSITHVNGPENWGIHRLSNKYHNDHEVIKYLINKNFITKDEVVKLISFSID